MKSSNVYLHRQHVSFVHCAKLVAVSKRFCARLTCLASSRNSFSKLERHNISDSFYPDRKKCSVVLSTIEIVLICC